MAPPLNPGVQAAGAAAAGAAAGVPGRAAIGGMATPSWDVDTSGLDQTSKKLQQITTDLSKLDLAVTKLTQKLGSMADKANSAFGGGQQGSRGGLTTAPVSGGTFGTNAGKTVAAGALGELAARGAGVINTVMGAVVTGGGPADVMARQSAAIFGGQTPAQNVAGFNQIQNTGTQDLNTALATMQANPMLFAQGGSAKQKNLTSFMNQLRKLNPNMTAAQAAQTANTLASGPALQALQRFGGQGGQLGQGLVNPKTMGVNSTNKVFSELLQTVTGGQHLTAAQMSAMAGSSAQATREWSTITQNNNVPGLGLGLSPQMLVELRQYAAAGGNLSTADKRSGGSPMATLLGKQTAKTGLSDTTYEKTTGQQNLQNTAETKLTNLLTKAVANGGPIPNLLGAFGSVTKGVLHFGETLAGADVLLKGIKTLKGTGGTATTAGKAATTASEVTGGETATEIAGGSRFGPWGVAAAAALAGLHSKTAVGAENKIRNKIGLPSTSDWLGPGGHDLGKIVGYNSNESLTKNLFGWMGDPATGSTTTKGMTPSLAKGISAMKAANPNIQITSGHRTTAQQKTLYALKGGKGVAKPGMSDHQTGHAADLGPPSQFGWIAKNASKFGLKRPDPKNEPWHVMGDPATGSAAVSVATSFLGTPYVWGGGNASGASKGVSGDSADPNAPNQVGLDCSGLVVAVFAKLGISMPRTSQQQAKVGTAVASLAAAQPGDIILYNEPGEGPNSHVAIYIGGGKQIAAPYTGQVVRVESVDKAHLSTIRRVLSGGNGHSVVQAAQAMVGSPSNDAANHSMGSNVGLQNTFIDQVNAGGTGGLGGAPAPPVASVSGAGAINTGVAAAGSSGASGGAATGGTMTAAQVLSLAMSAGLSKRAAQIATAVADVESRFRTAATDHDANGTTDYGLWQINSIHGVGTDMYNPTAAAAKMAQLTNKGTSWGAWAPDFGSSSYGGNPAVGGKVEAAMQQLGYMGDPVGGGMGDPTAAMVTSATGTGGGVATLTRGMNPGGGRPIVLNVTNQMINFSQQEADSMVKMVIATLKAEGGLSSVSEA